MRGIGDMVSESMYVVKSLRQGCVHAFASAFLSILQLND